MQSGLHWCKTGLGWWETFGSLGPQHLLRPLLTTLGSFPIFGLSLSLSLSVSLSLSLSLSLSSLSLFFVFSLSLFLKFFGLQLWNNVFLPARPPRRTSSIWHPSKSPFPVPSWNVLSREPSRDRIARSCRHAAPDPTVKTEVKNRIAKAYYRNMFWASEAWPYVLQSSKTKHRFAPSKKGGFWRNGDNVHSVHKSRFLLLRLSKARFLLLRLV